MSDPLRVLSDFLAELAPVPELEVRHLAGLLQERTLSAGQFLTRAGERPTEFALVRSGLLRKFYVSQDGREMTRAFAGPGELVGAYAALLTGAESKLSIQALETSGLFVLEFPRFEELYARHPCWNTLGRRVAERLFIEREERESDLVTLSPEQRYEKFRVLQPALFQRIPQYEIASYLGITPVSLSRLRARRKRRSAGPPV